jgi:hypothetical protein
MLFEIVLQQSYYGQTLINRWNYISTSTPAAVTLSFGLTAAFGGIPDPVTHAFPADSIMLFMSQLQNTNLIYASLTALNVYELDDFYTIPYTSANHGTNGTGDAMSPTAAYGLRSTQVTRAIRAGHKRIGGVPEGMVAAGGVIDTATPGSLLSLAETMSNPLTYDDEGTTLTYIPVVVSKEKKHPPGKESWAYYYYATLTEQMAHVAEGVIWSPMGNIRTQTSRQYGRGK